MKQPLHNRILALVLAAVMVLGHIPAVSAAPAGLSWKKSDIEVSFDKTDRLVSDLNTASAYKPTDSVRVSIVLEEASTLQAGYSTTAIADNDAALAYNASLQAAQKKMEDVISAQALGGDKLDVVWNMTLAGNIISANVPYGKIAAIEAVDGVARVVMERQYSLTETETGTAEPQMHSASGMIGAATVWTNGYTGAGSRVAIVDTGTDTDHQSFDNGAYLYALEQNAQAAGVSYEEYVASLDLLDAAEIASVLDLLNATERVGADAEDYYISEKLPFGANYVDHSLDVTHDNDAQGSHGSHVAGIAAANRYIPSGAGFVDAMDAVYMNGVAPDAQILTMKVFGNHAGPYDSDYFAAIEDAIWLGADSVNLSLGSGNPGTSYNDTYADLLAYLETTDTVVVMSAGNSGYWAASSAATYLYSDDVSFDTAGSPGAYYSSLGVASVDNNGTIGNYFAVGGLRVVYTETTGYGNNPMAALDASSDGSGTAYEYVFVDGIGDISDYAGIDLTGKVVFCYRGTTAFSEKGNNAASLGAAAVVICNNTSGSISMDLSDYSYAAPCVSITQSEAAAIRALSTRQTSSEGAEYYTGTLTISGKLGVATYDADYYTMSAFSSWGVPGDLSLKPEITAPGGSIWSVNGVETSGTSYELMSGTSMAAPQVTGMAALVAEYIRDKGLEGQTDLSVRHLAQSLLMSTAEPLREAASGGNYYSLLNQGAGLGRVDLATAAESYILVDGMDDGKVKVELGEDAARTGSYSFSFSINNLSGQAMSYALSADLFTQDVFDGGNGTMYLDTWTRNLASVATYTVDGVAMEGTGGAPECDLNGDGVTDKQDADYLLEYMMGNEPQVFADADVNGDGSVTSYDAHVLLSRLSSIPSVYVPANGSATVEVTLALTAEAKHFLDANYPSGAYVEAFVYAEPMADAEGVKGVTHSIPVLGYYGSWTEAGMYDVGSYLEYTYGQETRVPYLYNENGIRSNFLTINYGDGSEYIFGGNPIVEEAEYLPQRNAFNNENGAAIANLRFSLIRNAAAVRIVIENAETGEDYLVHELGELSSAYYHANLGAWQDTQYKLGLGWGGTNIPEDTVVNVSLVTAPELYRVYDETTGTYTADWSKVEDGGCLTTQFTVDNTEPKVLDVALGGDSSTLNVTARDNQYIAAVALMNAAGTSILTAAPANQTAADTQMTVQLDLRDVYGSEFLVAVYDYAENVAVYEVTLELENDRPYFTAIDRTNANDDGSVSYVGMETDGNTATLAPASGREPARAAEYVDGYVFEISNDNKLYVGSDSDLHSFTYLRDLDPTGEWELVGFNDLAYNVADGKIYGNFYSQRNNLAVPYLCTIDLYTGEMTVLGELPIDANSMAIDGAGNFYSATYNLGELYTYTADVVETQSATYVGTVSGYATTLLNSMAWDHNTDALYWACTADGMTYMLKVDPETAAADYLCYYDFICVGLYIPAGQGDGVLAPTDDVTAVTMASEATTLVNNTVRLDAQVWPWNVTDGSVTWSVADGRIAAVDSDGLVTGISQGTTTVTAASTLDPTKTATCQVTVSAMNKTLNGLVWDEAGYVWWSEFSTDTLPDYSQLSAVTDNLPLATTAVDPNGAFYAATLDTGAGISTLYTVDPDTFDVTAVGDSSIAYTDMAYAPNLGYILATYFNYVVLVDVSTGEYIGAFDWMESTGELVGITYYGSDYNSTYGAYMDYFLLIDSSGNAYLDAFINTGSQMGYFNGPDYAYVSTIGGAVDTPYFQGFHYDGSYAYWTRFNMADDVVQLLAWDCDNTGNVYHMGDFPEGVWPVGGLFTMAEVTSTNALMDESLTTASVKSAALVTDLAPAVLDTAKAAGGLNAVDKASVQPMSASYVEGDTVTFYVPLPTEAANGTMTVSYDAAALELTEIFGTATAFASRTESGAAEFAFACESALVKDTAIAVLTFKALTTGTTSLTVTAGEMNNGTLEHEEVFDITLAATGGTCGDNLTWSFNGGVLTISGEGAMDDFTFNLYHSLIPWIDYEDEITRVVIEEGVTYIGAYAFHECDNLTTVSIPNTVTAIGDGAFTCSGLTEVEIPASVTTIGDVAFRCCYDLVRVVLHDGLVTIGEEVFESCWNLPSLEIPDSVTSIGMRAFLGCDLLTSITLPSGLTEIERALLYGCESLTSVTIPAGVTTIGESAFWGCESLTELILPDKLTTIGRYAFQRCSGLTSMTIPAHVTSIGSNAFNSSGITEITFLGDAPFFDDGRNSGFVGGVFYKLTATAYYPYGNETWTEDVLQDYTGDITWIPYSTGEEVASGWSGYTTWVLTDDGMLTVSGQGAMRNYVTKTAMPWYAYKDQITAVMIEDGVTSIGNVAFYGMPNLEMIFIPETVTTIGVYAFKNSTSLDGVVLPSGLTQLGESAFYGCSSLTAIDIPASLWSVKPYTFKNCTALAEVTFHEGNLMKIWDAAFYNTALTGVVLPDCLDILDAYVFKNCSNLEYAILSDSMTEIREATFYGTAIPAIEIPEGITEIGPYAFKNCVELDTVYMPESLRSIGESAFYGCTGMSWLTIPEGVTTIGGYAFKNCAELFQLTLPTTLTDLGDSAFHSCTALTTLTIAENVAAVGAYCFSGSALNEITFLGSAPTIGTGAFNNVTATAYYPGDNATWTADVMRSYGGTITWTAQ